MQSRSCSGAVMSPNVLEQGRRSEQAFVSVVKEAYVAGVSTRKVNDWSSRFELRTSKSEILRLAGLDEQVNVR